MKHQPGDIVYHIDLDDEFYNSPITEDDITDIKNGYTRDSILLCIEKAVVIIDGNDDSEWITPAVAYSMKEKTRWRDEEPDLSVRRLSSTKGAYSTLEEAVKHEIEAIGLYIEYSQALVEGLRVFLTDIPEDYRK